MLGMKPIVLDGIFSKWVIQDKWEYTMDLSYSPDAKNIRLVNGNTVLRNWYILRVKDDTNIGKYPQGMTSLDNVYVARNSKLQKLNLATGLYEDIEWWFIKTVTVATGGTWYAVWNILTIVQAGASLGTVKVETVNAGVILTVSLVSPGVKYTVANGLACTGGAGTTATFNITETVAFTWDYPVEFIVFGKFIIALTWVSMPYVLNTATKERKQLDTTAIEWWFIKTITVATGWTWYTVGDVLTITQSWASLGTVKVETVNAGVILTVSVVSPGLKYSVATWLACTGWTWTTATFNITAITDANPSMGAVFAYWSYIAWWIDGNILYMSRWATRANPEYVYDRIWTWAEQLYMKGRILGMAATLNRLFIRTDKGIEYLSKDTISTVWGVTTTLSVPLSGENQPASQRSIVIADDIVFFLTKTLQVKSLNYTPWITEAQVGNISERPSQSIRTFFDKLEVDQSQAYGYYNKTQRTVTWYLKSKWAFCNDVCLVYDIINDSFLLDDNKIAWCGTFFNGAYYIGSNLNSYTYEADVGYDDDWAAISWYRYTKRISLGSPNKRKTLREVGTVGQISDGNIINCDVIAEWKLQYTWHIIGDTVSWFSGYWSQPTGWAPTWWEFPQWGWLTFFNKLITRWELRSKAVRHQLKYYWNTLGKDFVLSTVSLWVKGLDSTDLQDKI